MVRKTQSLENKESAGYGETQNQAVPPESISAVIQAFSRQFVTAIEHLETQNQADSRQRQNYEADELKWTKCAARAGIGFSVLSLLLSGLTLWVLSRTLGVYHGQAKIMANQAALYKEANQIAAISLAPNVIANVVWPKPEDYLSLTFTNIGHSTAYNFTIAPKISSRTFDPSFDPFKSLDWSVTDARTIEDLPPGEPTVSTYTVNRPEVREVLYLWGTYSFDSHVPEVPKETRRFCYMAQNGGEVWPCKSVHVVNIHGTISDSAQSGDRASVQIVKPPPTAAATPTDTK